MEKEPEISAKPMEQHAAVGTPAQQQPLQRHNPMIMTDSSDDEASQIRALDEEQGIYYPEEVVASPKNESDDDKQIRYFRPEIEKPWNSDDEANLDIQSQMERRRSVRFDAPEGEGEFASEKIHFRRTPSPETREYMDELANPMNDDDDISLNNDFAAAVRQQGESRDNQPPGSPPPYSFNHPFNHPPVRIDFDEYEGIRQPPVQSDASTKAGAPRGGLNELLITKVAQPFQNMIRRASRLEEENTSDDDDEEEDDDDFTEDEIQVLTYIDSYKVKETPLRPQLRPFMPRFMPVISDLDPFLKPPRPDDVEDNVGVTQLDEPASQQSDEVIVSMQIREHSKHIFNDSEEEGPLVKKLERADRNSDEIDKWIANIKELRRSKTAPSVHYKGPMPDIDTLMEEWHPTVEDAFNSNMLPSAELDVPLSQYVDICLNLCDVPVGKSRIQSLHLLFSVLNEFSNSQHFRNLAENNNLQGFTGEAMDRLEL